jgi:hypothetical protein
VAAVAELRIFLDILVIPHGQDDPEDRNREHEGDDDGLVPLAQAPFELVEYFGDEFVHDRFRGQKTEYRRQKRKYEEADVLLTSDF